MPKSFYDIARFDAIDWTGVESLQDYLTKHGQLVAGDSTFRLECKAKHTALFPPLPAGGAAGANFTQYHVGTFSSWMRHLGRLFAQPGFRVKSTNLEQYPRMNRPRIGKGTFGWWFFYVGARLHSCVTDHVEDGCHTTDGIRKKQNEGNIYPSGGVPTPPTALLLTITTVVRENTGAKGETNHSESQILLNLLETFAVELINDLPVGLPFTLRMPLGGGCFHTCYVNATGARTLSRADAEITQADVNALTAAYAGASADAKQAAKLALDDATCALGHVTNGTTLRLDYPDRMPLKSDFPVAAPAPAPVVAAAAPVVAAAAAADPAVAAPVVAVAAAAPVAVAVAAAVNAPVAADPAAPVAVAVDAAAAEFDYVSEADNGYEFEPMSGPDDEQQEYPPAPADDDVSMPGPDDEQQEDPPAPPAPAAPAAPPAPPASAALLARVEAAAANAQAEAARVKAVEAEAEAVAAAEAVEAEVKAARVEAAKAEAEAARVEAVEDEADAARVEAAAKAVEAAAAAKAKADAAALAEAARVEAAAKAKADAAALAEAARVEAAAKAVEAAAKAVEAAAAAKAKADADAKAKADAAAAAEAARVEAAAKAAPRTRGQRKAAAAAAKAQAEAVAAAGRPMTRSRAENVVTYTLSNTQGATKKRKKPASPEKSASPEKRKKPASPEKPVYFSNTIPEDGYYTPLERAFTNNFFA